MSAMQGFSFACGEPNDKLLKFVLRHLHIRKHVCCVMCIDNVFNIDLVTTSKICFSDRMPSSPISRPANPLTKMVN